MDWLLTRAPLQLCISIKTRTQTPIFCGDTLILYVNRATLSCQNGAGFQQHSSANQTIAVCHGNNLQGDMEENTMGMGRPARKERNKESKVPECRRKQETWINLQTDQIFCPKVSRSTARRNVAPQRRKQLMLNSTTQDVVSVRSEARHVGADLSPCNYINTNRKLGEPTSLTSFYGPQYTSFPELALHMQPRHI